MDWGAGRMRLEVVVVYFKVLSRDSSAEIEKSHKTFRQDS
jgi:hypothetical protein